MPSRVISIALSNVASDPRVRRQCQAFRAAGWDVLAVGFGETGATADTPWSIAVTPEPAGDASLFRRAIRILLLLGCKVHSSLWQPVYRMQLRHRAVRELAESIESATLVIANDWNSLPIAAELADRCGARLVYDSHEYATGERSENWRWRLFYPQYIAAIEKTFLQRIAVLSTVSQGIAELLERNYRLAQSPVVIRNVPVYQEMPCRPVGQNIRILYHGVVIPGRGLEALVASVKQWRPGIQLTIRGPANADYIAHLKQIAGDAAQRIEFAPPVAVQDLVRMANEADVGIHVLPAHSDENRLALPNKFFEYIMAGLALCISDVPEMRGLLQQHQVGWVLQEDGAEAIAAMVNAMTVEAIEQCKRNALLAAKTLCWEAEADVMIAAYTGGD
ncbi:glycosyltransferase family 4 protein [Ferrovibrio sp.]|uniref:glycosyltransferase family 4 protein n=1 Tax=Ferrovibrio sp. TaxID=1917215 RepID=UPI0035AF2ED6